MTTENRATVRIIGGDESAGRSVVCEILHWNIAPENMPYALHAGVQPELIPTGEIIHCRVKDQSMVIPGSMGGATRRGDEWIVEAVTVEERLLNRDF